MTSKTRTASLGRFHGNLLANLQRIKGLCDIVFRESFGLTPELSRVITTGCNEVEPVFHNLDI